MIVTLLVTLLVEGCVVLAYSALYRKPSGGLLQASLVVNLLTQVMLWLVLMTFHRQYLVTLIASEVMVWLIESVLLYHLVNKQLSRPAALFLSLCMNLASFGIGWFLPV